MKNKIVVGDKTIEYTVKRVKRSKSIRIIVHQDGSVVLTHAWHVSRKRAEEFLSKREGWLVKKLAQYSVAHNTNAQEDNAKHYKRYKNHARRIVLDKLDYWSSFYGLKYNKVFIRNQKTRWGSASSNKNLNFNYKICMLPEGLQDYLIVHELCHLKEMNHSSRFWKLVEKAIPDYKMRRKKLGKTSMAVV